MKASKIIVLLFFLFTLPILPQQDRIRAELPMLTDVDDFGPHLTRFKKKPDKALKLPLIDTAGARFFSAFYTFKSDNPEISVMVIPKDSGEELYIDMNRDYDLTNDNSPFIFPYNQVNFTFDIISRDDPSQKTKILLQRRPDNFDSLSYRYVDSSGNLNPHFLKFYSNFIQDNDFTGKHGTFYFDNPLGLRRGEIALSNNKYQIGIFDYDNNGLFNDDDDLLLIDRNNSGKLEIDATTNVFKLNDIFTVGQESYKITMINKYGHWLEIRNTEEEPTFYYLKHLDSLNRMYSESNMPLDSISMYKNSGTTLIDEDVWNISATTIDGNAISFNKYKGKYVLLNFWGEWCKPCIGEIPELVKANSDYGTNKLQIISFLYTSKLEDARTVIKEKGITWPQISLSEPIQNKFKIKSYPTNILIFPDGKTCVQYGIVNRFFFNRYIE
ncbi:MAG: TlpA disulfide reductase family protein [Bacteroidota bacterium]|nr:TlpA disulfide reductase family protein [Bacteroidota bacterium]